MTVKEKNLQETFNQCVNQSDCPTLHALVPCCRRERAEKTEGSKRW